MTAETNDSAVHRLLLVEDDSRTRDRLAQVIAADRRLDLVAAVGTFSEGLQALESHSPDVLITDLGLPDGDGTDLIRAATQGERDVLAMAITVFGDERHVVAAIEAGALGYVLKDGTPQVIARSILEMIDGGSPISSPIARYLLKRMQPVETAEPSESDVPKLSGREREVLGYVVKGFSYSEIAKLLEVSPHTVTTHVRGIYRKLAVSSRGEAVYEALQLGIVRLDE